MNIVFEQQVPSHLILTIRDDIERNDIPRLQRKLEEMIPHQKSLVLDFEETGRIHSAAVAVFSNVQLKMRENGCELFFCRTPIDFIFLLQLTNTSALFHFCATIDDVIDPDVLETQCTPIPHVASSANE